MNATVWLSADRQAGKIRCPNAACRRWYDVDALQIDGTEACVCPTCGMTVQGLMTNDTIVSDEDLAALSGFTPKIVRSEEPDATG